MAVVLMDVAIGDGSHPNPAGLLAPVAADVLASGAAVVAYVLGTELDLNTSTSNGASSEKPVVWYPKPRPEVLSPPQRSSIEIPPSSTRSCRFA